MIKLNLGIGKGEIHTFVFNTVQDVLDYVQELNSFKDVVWLVAGLANNSNIDEIIITESVEVIMKNICFDLWRLGTFKDSELHIHEYESYEDAYLVALDMREGNKLQF